MRYVITDGDTVEVSLEDLDGDISLTVGDWEVARLTEKGELVLVGDIDANNNEGLKTVNGYIKVTKE